MAKIDITASPEMIEEQLNQLRKNGHSEEVVMA